MLLYPKYGFSCSLGLGTHQTFHVKMVNASGFRSWAARGLVTTAFAVENSLLPVDLHLNILSSYSCFSKEFGAVMPCKLRASDCRDVQVTKLHGENATRGSLEVETVRWNRDCSQPLALAG